MQLFSPHYFFSISAVERFSSNRTKNIPIPPLAGNYLYLYPRYSRTLTDLIAFPAHPNHSRAMHILRFYTAKTDWSVRVSTKKISSPPPDTDARGYTYPFILPIYQHAPLFPRAIEPRVVLLPRYMYISNDPLPYMYIK